MNCGYSPHNYVSPISRAPVKVNYPEKNMSIIDPIRDVRFQKMFNDTILQCLGYCIVLLHFNFMVPCTLR